MVLGVTKAVCLIAVPILAAVMANFVTVLDIAVIWVAVGEEADNLLLLATMPAWSLVDPAIPAQLALPAARFAETAPVNPEKMAEIVRRIVPHTMNVREIYVPMWAAREPTRAGAELVVAVEIQFVVIVFAK